MKNYTKSLLYCFLSLLLMIACIYADIAEVAAVFLLFAVLLGSISIGEYQRNRTVK